MIKKVVGGLAVAGCTIVGLAGCGSGSPATAIVLTDYSAALVQNIEANAPDRAQADGATASAAAASGGISLSYAVSSAECVQQAGTQTYTCSALLTVTITPPSYIGTPPTTSQPYQVAIAGSCTNAGACKWTSPKGQLSASK